jgi:dienelactone hydrolase
VRITRKGDFTQLRVERDARQSPEGDFEIAGSLNIPSEGKGPWPAVFFISGSGPQDRHGFTPGARQGTVGLDCGTWEILDALAESGFVVLRVDDRMTGATPLGPQGVDYRELGFFALVSDARSCMNWLKEQPEVDRKRVFVIGHSEGGITAPVLASEVDSGLAGIVCMAGCGRNFYEVIFDQVAEAGKNQPEALREASLKIQRELMNATKENREPDYGIVPKALWNRPDVVATRKWSREHFNLDLTAIHKKVSCPALVVNGESDFQVSSEKDARLLAAEVAQGKCKDVTLRLYPDLDHLFKACGGRPSTMKIYEEKRPIDAVFLRDLLQWLKARAG